MTRDRLRELGIERVEIDHLVTAEHVAAFVDTFVVADSRTRIRKVMRRSGWRGETNSLLVERLDRRLCVLDEQHSRPVAWDPRFLRAGIYIDDCAQGLRMTIDQAAALSQKLEIAALYSIEAGKLAVVFNYEWGVWYCSAPSWAPK